VAEGFADGDSADLEFLSDSLLSKLLAFRQFTAQDLFAEAFNNSSCERLTRDGTRFWLGNRFHGRL
jgi:hypothetical protein